MGKSEKKAYLEAIRKRYRQAKKDQKAIILNEFCLNCGYHRKHAIRVLKAKSRYKPRSPGKKAIYQAPELKQALKNFWFAAEQPCSKKLKAILPAWLPSYETNYGTLKPEIRALLLSISPASIDRVLKPIRVQARKGKSGTKPGTLLKNQIPIQTNAWDNHIPGFVEADTVAHCGDSLAGDFVWSLTLTDICSTWTVCRATWGKGSTGVMAQIQDIEKHLPFSLKGFDCDNGSEFLNHHLLRYFADNKVQFTRSRPYHKNDNAHVEQKNWTHVRQLFGYDRFEKKALVALMNDLYANEWSHLQNHFIPVQKLIKKQRINSKYKKTYDIYQTPYERLLKSECITEENKNRLKSQHNKLDPFILKKEMERKLRVILGLVR